MRYGRYIINDFELATMHDCGFLYNDNGKERDCIRSTPHHRFEVGKWVKIILFYNSRMEYKNKQDLLVYEKYSSLFTSLELHQRFYSHKQSVYQFHSNKWTLITLLFN